LKKRHLLVFSNEDIIRIFGCRKHRLNSYCIAIQARHYHSPKERPLYTVRRDRLRILYCQSLCEPSYVSLETALSFHNIIPETVYAITSITTKATRERTANGKSYQYHRILRSAFTGYKPVSLGDFTVLVADRKRRWSIIATWSRAVGENRSMPTDCV